MINQLLSTDDFVIHISNEIAHQNGLLKLYKVDFDPDEFISSLKKFNMEVISSSDGLVSKVIEREKKDDLSQTTTNFDWHTDGLYYDRIPDYVILFCNHPGRGKTPTIFSDTRDVKRNLLDVSSWQTLKKLVLNYISKTGKVYQKPLLNKHPIGNQSVVQLGSRVYIGSQLDINLGNVPTCREINTAVQDLYQALDNNICLRHFWSKNDIVIFDNRTYLHARIAESIDRSRELLRLWIRTNNVEK